MKKAVIVGAGPAGLTAAYELLDKTEVSPLILEETNAIGGISQTVNVRGNRIDIGGHRFFSKNKNIMNWWTSFLPIQGYESKDNILLNQHSKKLNALGPNPEIENHVMLVRHRVSRIFFRRHFFDYPISLRIETFVNMGITQTLKAIVGYLMSVLHKRNEDSLESFYINRFGKPLYNMFFEDYTEKVWGIHPSKLGADWGSQRVKGVSIWAVVKDMFLKKLGKKKDSNTETSLIENFLYPKLGPGQLWETVGQEIIKKGGEIKQQAKVVKIHLDNWKVSSVDYLSLTGKITNSKCDYLLSTMPIKDLIEALSGIDIPEDVKYIASNLQYRDFITAGICVKELAIKNHTKIKTFKNRVPDTWIYIQERDVKIGRLQIFNNWSPYLVKDYESTMWLGLEYFCTEGDTLWSMTEEDFIQMAIDELVKIDIIKKEDVVNTCQLKIKKAYPSYYGSYKDFDKVKNFLNKIDNLYCLGRNGQHRYNNMDHSMLTAIECVQNIKNGIRSKENIWAVNTEEDYHEEEITDK